MFTTEGTESTEKKVKKANPRPTLTKRGWGTPAEEQVEEVKEIDEVKEKKGKSSPQRTQRAQRRNKDSNLEIRILGKPKSEGFTTEA